MQRKDSKKDDAETPTQRIRRITNTPTIVPADSDEPAPHADPTTHAAIYATKGPNRRASGLMNSTAALSRYRYQPAFDVWRCAIEQLQASGELSPAEAESWLQPCELSVMDLPSGKVCAAALRVHSSFAADHVRHRYASAIRFTIQRVVQKQVVLFVRGPAESPYDGPPDGYDAA